MSGHFYKMRLTAFFVFRQILLMVLASAGFIYVSLKVQYVWIFSSFILMILIPFTITDILCGLFGRYVLMSDGVHVVLGKFHLNKFLWKEVKRIDLRRRWGAIIELFFIFRNGRVKSFGKEVIQSSVFLNELSDEAAKHNIEVKELDW